MTASPADVLRAYLKYLGLAVDPTPRPPDDQWSVVTGPMPSSPNDPDNFIAIENTGSRLQGRIMHTGEQVKFWAVQLMIRSDVEPTGWDKGYAIEDALRKVGVPVPNGGVGWVTQTVMGGIWTMKAAHLATELTRIGQDETNRRQLFTLNYRLTLIPG